MSTVSQSATAGRRYDQSSRKELPAKSATALLEAFRLFDKDGDGNITADELYDVMSSIGQMVSREQAVDMIQLVDTDGNGLIDFNEFSQMMKNFRRTSSISQSGRRPSGISTTAASEAGVSSDAEFRPLFAAFDKDNSGFIDAVELKTTMAAVGLELSDYDVEMMMKAAGVAKGERIYYEDFVKILVSSGLGAESPFCGVSPSADQSLNASICSLDQDDTINEEELQELGVAFSTFDKDGDGQITVDEVEMTIKAMGLNLTRDQLQMMVDLVDTDGNGSISFSEFCQLMTTYKNQDTCSLSDDTVLRDTFNIFDKDHDGLLCASDLKDTMLQIGVPLTDEDVRAMMKSVGVGPHGKISYSDFCKILSFNEKSQSKAQNGSQTSVKDKRKYELRAVFRLFDKDDDGFITIKEVTEMLQSMGIKPSQSRIKEIFRQVDLDGNNQIDFEEFVLLVDNYEKPMSSDREIREMFNAIDKDRSGFIDVAELKTTFTTLGVELSDSDVRTMLKEADIKGNRIFFEDFVRIIMATLGNGSEQTPAAEVSKVAPAKVNGNSTDAADFTAEFHVQFAQFDKNGDGRITQAEMYEVMKSLGFEVQPKEVSRILRQVDSNNDGTIDFDEFCTVMSRCRSQYGERRSSSTSQQPVDTKQVFKVFDKNDDGFIDESELQQTMKELGVTLSNEDVNEMFTEVGCGHTRRITYAEFARLVMKAAPSFILTDLTPTESSSMSDRQSTSSVVTTPPSPSPPPISSSEEAVVTVHASWLEAAPPSTLSHDRSAPIEVSNIRTLVLPDQSSSLPEGGSKLSGSPPDTWKAFRVFDRNGDGYVSKSELYHTLKDLGVNLSLEELNNKMKEADTNQDGCIDYADLPETSYVIEEFRQLMKGAFEIYARQAVLLHRQRSLNESTLQQTVVNRSKVRQSVQTLFESVDTDHDDRINADQLMHISSTLTLKLKSKHHANALIAKYGSKGDGTINFNEFQLIRTHCEAGRERQLSERSQDTEQRLRTAFKVFDVDGNGVIDSKELSDTLAELGNGVVSQSNVEELLRAADKNGDGQIDYEEFILMMYP